MNIIDGKTLAKELKDNIKSKTELLETKPKLVVIQVGDDPASSVYVRNKSKAAEYCGIESTTMKLTEETTTTDLLNLIKVLNCKPSVNGILVQLPLPKHINESEVLEYISPEKDVDGFHPMNVAKLWLNDKSAILPCTPKGIIKLIESTGTDISGKTAVVIGRSNIVGKPITKLLLDKGATVTICHSKTREDELIYACLNADIIVVATGHPKTLRADMLNPNRQYIIIDVGINRLEDGSLVGDVDFESLKNFENVSITPVPGGVGPMTIACLMENTYENFVKNR